ncbi:MAG: Uncharacterized protein DUF547 [Olavius algarvensis Gamma 3 endosymbiont]|nr:MAG: Uncharacterized protein DUF547 [Olavius algarvensis Gamma 3 endosymbiont]
MQIWRQLAATGLTLLLLGCYPLAQAAPAAKLWDRWNAFNPASSATIDHRPWHSWLETFVVSGADGINRVAYGQVTAADRTRLRAYIDSLTALSISDFKRDQQRAYWINLYNALTIDIVLEHFPLNSIRDISRGLFSSGPWRLKLATIEGEALTLDDIEHRILRPIWRDPRIHYALNCASLGCPNLQPVAFTAANTETLLESSARDFINHPRGASVIDKRLKVSRIYDWFEQDFGGNEAGVIKHLRQYASDGLAAALDPIEDIGDYAYDWQINAQE